MARHTPQKVPSKTRDDSQKAGTISPYRAVLLLILAAISSTVSQVSLSPSHGSIPAALYHSTLVLATVFIVLSVDFLSTSISSKQLSTRAQFIPIIVSWDSVIHLLLTPTARSLGPAGSALLIECLAYVPMLALVLSISWRGFRVLVPDSTHAPSTVPLLLTGVLFMSFEVLVARTLPGYIGLNEVLTRPFLSLVVAGVTAILLPSRLLLFAALPIFHTLTLNPHTPFESINARLNSTLSTEGFSLLARRESLTGYLSVLENHVEGFRVMRCDHSLLGGEWVPGVGRWPGGKGSDGLRGVVGEPVYSVFIMLEAIRLVRSGDGKEDVQNEEGRIGELPPSVPDRDAKALVM